MKEKDKNNTERSGFLRYIRGEMDDRERNAFERELQKDAFKEEALDGFSEFPADQTAADLSGLDRRLKARISRRKSIIIYRIAASVAVLLVLSTVLVVMNRKSISEMPAEIAYRSEILEISESKGLKEPPVPAASAERREDIIIEKAATENRTGTSTRMKVAGVPLSDDKGKAAATERSDKLIPTIAESKPAEIIPGGRQAGTGGQVAASIAGVSSKTAVDMELNRQLTYEDSMVFAMEEVVAVGYGAARKTKNEITGYSPPAPVIGSSGFERYISENIRKPATLDEGERVVVVVNMIVRSSGVIDSLKIVKSPGKEFSEEALRLIREGPEWNPAVKNGVKTDEEIRIRIIFK